MSSNSQVGAILTLTLALALPRDQAKSMAELLLKLGATSSQAESTGCTALHRYVGDGRMDLVDALWDNDKTAVKTAINHLVFDGSYWDPQTIAPLHLAVEHGDPILVLKLLNAGAKSQIDFETWLKAAKISPTQADKLGTLEQNQRKYKESVEQPLISAIRAGNPDVALKLLEDGADPNALTSKTESLIFNEYQRSWNKGESALDLVQKLIRKLQAYGGEKMNMNEPTEELGIDSVLEKFTPGTYTHWIYSEDVSTKKKNFENQKKSYEKEVQRIAEIKGAPEKMEAIKEALDGLNALAKELTSRGGQTFEKLRPDIKTEERNNSSRNNKDKNEPSKYNFFLSFKRDSDLTEARTAGYVELMEAAWTGDIEKIKTLSLQAWGPEQDQPPLKMAVEDNMGNTPFSVAFIRGHHDTAQAILEIVKAQWSPVDKEKVRFKMEQRDEDEYDDSEDEGSDGSEDNEPRIVSETVDKKFTIDNIGQVSMQVKSHTRPIDVINERVPNFHMEGDKVVHDGSGRSLFIHVFNRDDTAGLKALLDMAQHYAGQKMEGDEEEEEGSSGSFTFSQYDFQWAVEEGKSRLLALVIKRTGAGIPLDHLVRKSGVEMKKKPRYYQGLTVYGKKR